MRDGGRTMGARFEALDWEALGRMVREQADEAVAMHVDGLGDTDNPVVPNAKRHAVEPGFKLPKERMDGGTIGLSSALRSMGMEVRP